MKLYLILEKISRDYYTYCKWVRVNSGNNRNNINVLS